MFNQHGNLKSSQDADYLVVVFNWGSGDGVDLDTGTEFINSGIYSLDQDGVGYGLGYSTYDLILQHGGDNTTSGDESFVIDVKKLKTTYYDIIPNLTYIKMYGTWYNSRANGNISIEINSYKGGTMSLVGKTWINTGGNLVSSQLINTNVLSAIKYSSTWRSDYTYLGEIIYNKIIDTSIFEL